MKKRSKTDRKRVSGIPDEAIDFSDIAELDESFFRETNWQPPAKKPVTIRIDQDVIEWFRGQGPGYQTRINRLLRRYMEVNQKDLRG